METRDLRFRNLLEVSDLIRQRATTSVAVTEALLRRIATLDPVYGSYLHVCGERALQRAEALDQDGARGIWKGPLHGVPIAVKDLCCTTFAPTTAGTTIHAGFMAPFDATVVERLEQAGAVILGKLTMTEGAYTSHHPRLPAPINPWGDDYWVGASSSGSGVATAAGLCYGSLGSDTGGSIRFPSAACGLTGIKPTWGRVSRHGVFALADSLDHIGPMARSAGDAAALLQAIAGWDPNDPTSIDAPVPDYLAELGRGVRGLCIGIDRTYALDGIDPEVAAALEAALEVFAALGARIVEVTLPDWEALVGAWIMMCAVETAVAHKDTYPRLAADYGPELAGLIEQGHRTTGIETAEGLHLRLAFGQALETLFRDVDALLIPTLTVPVPTLARMAEFGGDPRLLQEFQRFTAPFDFSGHPTVTLPNGADGDGLPLSMQIVGPRLGEAVLVRAAQAYQTATAWHCRHPID